MIEFTVYAKPEPQGSMRAFTPKGWKRPILTSDNPKIKGYRQQVAQEAFVAMGTRKVIGRETGIRVIASFFFSRPPSKPKRILYPTTIPDLDKICRSLGDSMKGIVYEDDSQIVELITRKRYGSPERTEVRIETLGPDEAQSDFQTGNLFKD